MQPKNKNTIPLRKEIDIFEESKNNFVETIKIASRFDEISKKSEAINSKKGEEFDKMQYKGMPQKTYDARRSL